MAEVVYLLCAATSLLCATMLIRSWLRTRVRLLFWSSVCFAGLAANNVLLFIDLVVVTTAIDLSIVRGVCALASLAVLLGALVWDAT
jgi:hypothetical protein